MTIELAADAGYRSIMTKGEEFHKRAEAAEAHAEKSLGITRAHFQESAKQWHEKALEAGYAPVVEKPRRTRSAPRAKAAPAAPAAQT
jgi:hypothetical protein